MVSYYDLILALIPLTLIGGTLGLMAVGMSLTAAIPAGASMAVLLIGHAMFVRSPAGESAGSPSEVGTASVSDVVAD